MAITLGGVVKTLATSAAACGIAVIAPVGVPTVIGITVAVGLANLFIENVADDLQKKKKGDTDEK